MGSGNRKADVVYRNCHLQSSCLCDKTWDSVRPLCPGNVISKNFSAVDHSESLDCIILGCAVNKDTLGATPCTLIACHLSVLRFKVSKSWPDSTSYFCCWQMNQPAFLFWTISESFPTVSYCQGLCPQFESLRSLAFSLPSIWPHLMNDHPHG